MKNNPSIWMAVLTFTALIMAVMYVAIPQPEAQGAMLNAQSNFSLMTAGAVGGDEALIVVDKGSQRMLVFALNGNQLEVIAPLNFGR